MTQRILTSVALVVPPERADDLVGGYRDLIASSPRPDGLLRSELLRGPDRWLIQTLWRDMDAIVDARRTGAPPPALALAERLGVAHSHEAMTVEEALDGDVA